MLGPGSRIGMNEVLSPRTIDDLLRGRKGRLSFLSGRGGADMLDGRPERAALLAVLFGPGAGLAHPLLC